MPRSRTLTPRSVTQALAAIGADLATWRKLRGLTQAQVAERSGVAVSTVAGLERGAGTSLENALRVARSLGILDQVTASTDPYATDVGRLRADEALPKRVRARRSTAEPT